MGNRLAARADGTAAVATARAEAPAWRVVRRLARNRLAMLGLAIIVIFVALAVLAPWIAPHDPLQSSFAKRLQPPSAEHWLGTDELGRDMLSRLLYGARISLRVGLISVNIGIVIGVPLGAISAYYGGWVDLIVQRVIDVMLAFPGILLAIVLVSTLGVGLENVMIAVGIVSIPVYTRLVRGSALALKRKDFVEAARAAGARDLVIIARHILPNCVAPVIVQSTLQVGSSILWAAGLGFLGLGAQPPTPEWGTILSRGRQYLLVAPHITTATGLSIMLVVLGFNLLGDGLRDALDPRLKE
ncbi:MAG TPA: nickel transporter permease [Limnochordales bacterium]